MHAPPLRNSLNQAKTKKKKKKSAMTKEKESVGMAPSTHLSVGTEVVVDFGEEGKWPATVKKVTEEVVQGEASAWTAVSPASEEKRVQSGLCVCF